MKRLFILMCVLIGCSMSTVKAQENATSEEIANYYSNEKINNNSNLMGTLIQMCITSGPSVLLIAALIFWGKSFISYFFNETIEIKKKELTLNLENYKQQLEQENSKFNHQLNLQTEEYKNNLEILKQEYQIKFSHLHVQRAKVIKELYLKFIEVQLTLMRFSIQDKNQEILNHFQKVLSEFVNYYIPNKIFISKSLCKKIDDLFKICWEEGIYFNLINNSFSNIEKVPKHFYEDLKTNLINHSKKIYKEIPELINELTDDFRKILGDKDEIHP